MTKALVGNSPIVDDINGYGPVGARNLDKSIALHNADSYLYYALVSSPLLLLLFLSSPPPLQILYLAAKRKLKALTMRFQETFWTTVASKDFGDPVPGVDDQDPVCGGSPCTG